MTQNIKSCAVLAVIGIAFHAMRLYLLCKIFTETVLVFLHSLYMEMSPCSNNTKIKIGLNSPSDDKGRILIRILVTVSNCKGLRIISAGAHFVYDRLYSAKF